MSAWRSSRAVWLRAACLVAVAWLLLAARPAGAVVATPCTVSGNTTLTLGSVAVAPGTPNGAKLGSPTTVTVTFNCSNATSSSTPYTTIQVADNSAAIDTNPPVSPPNGGIMFKTAVPGIELNLTATPNQAGAGPNGPAGVPGWELGTVCPYSSTNAPKHPQTCNSSTATLTATFTAQLVKVGPVSAGTVATLQLGQFTNYSYGITNSAPYYATTLNVASSAVTTMCSTAVLPSSTIVLPTVSLQSFKGVGTTGGETPFTIQLNCTPAPQGSPGVAVSLNTASPQAGATGVIAPTAGTGNAKNVGVQLLQADGTTPVGFGATIPEGSIPPTGSLPLTFYARYYQTATGVTAGKVTATATYTLIYP